MPDGTAILDTPILQKPIIIPEAKLSAPGDYDTIRRQIIISGKPKRIDLIKQIYQGNCAEYTVLNTVLLAQAAGFVVNSHVDRYLSNNPNLNLDCLENDFIVPFLFNSQDRHKELQIQVEDVDNVGIKASWPHEPLTKTNSILLFRDALTPNRNIKFDKKDLMTMPGDIQRIKLEEVAAIFIGTNDHATSILKLGGQYLHIDPYFNSNVVRSTSEVDAFRLLNQAITQRGSIVTMNALYTK